MWGNKRRMSPMIAGLPRRFAMTEGLKLTIFTYKWGKCVKSVGKYLLKTLV